MSCKEEDDKHGRSHCVKTKEKSAVVFFVRDSCAADNYF